jgi:hypothetical protein
MKAKEFDSGPFAQGLEPLGADSRPALTGQPDETKKAEPKLRRVVWEINSPTLPDVVVNPQVQKCGLKYVMQSSAGQCRLQILTLEKKGLEH